MSSEIRWWASAVFIQRLYDKCQAVHEHADYYDHIIRNLRKIEIVVKKVEFLAKLPRPSLNMEKPENRSRGGCATLLSGP